MTGAILNDELEIRTQLEALHAESFAWAMACCGHQAADAEEVLQLSYAKILEGRARCSGRSTFKTWFFGVIRMTAREHQRRTWFRWLKFAPLEEADEPASESTVDESLASAERLAQVQAALARLPARQRQVLLLVFYHDLTLDAAAEAMGVSPGSARTHYERGKRKLAELLPGDVFEP